MKKFVMVIALVLCAAFIFVACGAEVEAPAVTEEQAAETKEEVVKMANFQEPWTEDIDTDNYADAVLYDDLVDLLGPIPMPDEPVKIGYVAKAFENEYWRSVKEGAEDESATLAEEGVSVSVDVKAAQGESDDQGQLAIMNAMLNEDYQALLLSPITDANLEPAIETAFEMNIPMVNVVGGFAKVVPAYVGPRHIESGELAAKWVADQLGESGGQVACIVGIPTAGAARNRTDGFVDWFGSNAPQIEVVDTQNADWDRLKAKDVMEVWIKTYPDLKAVYCNNDTMAMGALEAVKGADKLGEIMVVGNDGTGEAYDSIRNGELSATVNIFPFYNSKMSIDIALRILAGQEVPRVIWTTQALIDQTNVDVSADEIVGWSGLQFDK